MWGRLFGEGKDKRWDQFGSLNGLLVHIYPLGYILDCILVPAVIWSLLGAAGFQGSNILEYLVSNSTVVMPPR